MRKNLIIFLAIAIFAALLAGGFASARHAMHGRIDDLLASYGFPGASVGDTSYHNGYIVYRDIQLDADGFSQISDIQIPASHADLLLQKAPERITINAVKLSGRYDRNAGLEISGWHKRRLPLPLADALALNGAQLDLMTSEGALRIEAKGTITPAPNGIRKLQGAVWAAQNQLTANTLWTGEISPDGRWVYDIDIQEGNINFDRFQGSRITGWLVLDKSKGLIPSISGQIEAGKLTFGDVDLMSTHLTLSGPVNLYKLIASGRIGGYQDMAFTVEAGNKAGGPNVSATIETASVKDLIAFLTDLQKSNTVAGALTPLLLTQGNLERLEKQVKGLRYDVLELQIYGSVYDLAGKLTAKRFKDGVSQNNVISLDPGVQR